ncbi:MAG: hypothetical protein P8L44_07380, partial [Opitutales bacterium]|nr:hypothetical protein [Opitutales bacterium]
VVCTIDLAASLASMAGIELPSDGILDSFDVHEALLGEPGAKGRGHLVQQDNGKGNNYGLRVGNWKLQRHDSGKARNIVVTNKLANTNVSRHRLYDLSTDIREENNLAAVHPEVFEDMKAQLAKIIEDGRSRF